MLSAFSGGSPYTPSLSKTAPVPDTVQIIGLSATLSNAQDLCKCLSATLYVTDYRPVPLAEFAKLDDRIYHSDGTVARTLPKLQIPKLPDPSKRISGHVLGMYKKKAASVVATITQRDGDHIARLTHEITSQGNSVIIFCASREACQKVATMVGESLANLRQVPLKTLYKHSDSLTQHPAITGTSRAPKWNCGDSRRSPNAAAQLIQPTSKSAWRTHQRRCDSGSR
jgi:replicative superfamily II helicase